MSYRSLVEIYPLSKLPETPNEISWSFSRRHVDKQALTLKYNGTKEIVPGKFIVKKTETDKLSKTSSLKMKILTKQNTVSG